MNKCRYIPECELPRNATDGQVDAILAALDQRRYKLVGKAQRQVVGPWGMTAASFIEAIRAHLEEGNRIFQKTVQNPPPDTLLFSGNIRLDPDSNDEDDDVYVEIRLTNRTVVILCDAHGHYKWQPRLPK